MPGGEERDPYDVVDISEIQAMLGLLRSRTDTITRYRSFPAPVIKKARYRLWHREDIERWLDDHRPGWRER